MSKRPWIFLCAAAALCACDADYSDTSRPGGGKADHPVEQCLFGETTDEWEEGIDGLIVEDGWLVVDKNTTLWDGALEQITVTLDFPGGPTTFEGMLLETQDEEFFWKEIFDQRSGVGYIVWGYIGGDNLSGAIFELDSAVAVARLSDQEIAHCTVERGTVTIDCSMDEGDTPMTARELPTTGRLVEVDAIDRLADGTLYDDTDVDWYRVPFSSENRCIDCFNPYALISRSQEHVAEVCVFVDAYEAESRGGTTQCFGGESATEPGLVGCCTTEVDRMVNFDTDWDHEAGDGSTMYIRVRAAQDAPSCQDYQITYGHFTG